MLIRTFLSMGAALAIMAAAPASADEPMTAQEILRLAPGTFHAVVKGKFQLVVTLSRDGAAVGKIPGQEDRGRWTVRDNQLCIVLPTWTNGKVECSRVVADNGWYRGRNVSFRKL
jgi:hypothetical protein